MAKHALHSKYNIFDWHNKEIPIATQFLTKDADGTVTAHTTAPFKLEGEGMWYSNTSSKTIATYRLSSFLSGLEWQKAVEERP